MFPSLFCGSCCKKKSEDDIRRSSVVEAEERFEALKQFQVAKIDAVPPAKYIPLTFIPDMIVKEIQEDNLKSIPCQVHSEALLLIADVCGFTSLTESYCEKGVSGIEELASVLNGYMSTLSAMLLASDGDILNFAGDAFLVSWMLTGEEKDRIQTIEKVFNCAIALQTHKSLQTKNLNGRLRIKIGIGCGNISTWILGSSTDFLMFAVSGPGVVLTHKAEEMCDTGDIIVTEEIFTALKSFNQNSFKSSFLEDGFVKVYDYIPNEGPEPYPCRTHFMEQCDNEEIAMAKLFSIPSVRDVSRVSELNYLSELTTVTILFVAMLNIQVEEPYILDKTFDIILECAKKQGGILNKMLLFDKGCTYLIVFGLPGNKHSNDAARGLLCANDIVEKHAEINVEVSIGVTSGMCFCGIVGHAQRQEYTVIGNRVNLAARIMVVYKDQYIALDRTTFVMSRDVLEESNFVQLANRKMKGIEDAGQIYAYLVTNQRNARLQSGISLQVIEVESVQCGIGTKKDSIANCLDTLCNPDKRYTALSSMLLPVMIIEGPTGCGRNYYLYYAVDRVNKMGYRALGCCTIPSYKADPFATAGLLVKHMLDLQETDSVLEREEKIMAALPGGFDPQLYLLNHLFVVQFPPPKLAIIDKDYRIRESIRLFKSLFLQYSADLPLIVAIDEADSMDPWSWDLLQDLCSIESFVLLLSLRQDFRRPSISASLLLLKAYTHIKVGEEEMENFPALICWFMRVKAVHKSIYRFLRDKTGHNIQLLNEVLLSPSLSQYIEVASIENLNEKQKNNFYFCEFPLPQDNKQKVYMCNMKAGSNLKNMVIPSNINDAVKDTLNFLSNPDRLLLKRAALLGEDFDQHVLEAASPEFNCEEVAIILNGLMSLGVISSVCTSKVILDKSPKSGHSPQLLKCHDICFCSCVKGRNVFRDYEEAHFLAGPYHRLKFRTDEFRLCILSYMTKEQYCNMHQEIVQELESQGLLCVSCRIKQMEKIRLEDAGQNERLGSIHVDISVCACLQKRPKVFSLIGHIWQRLGDKILPAYFAKKAAQAFNDLKYPVQALSYALTAEELLPHQSEAFLEDHLTKDRRDFDISVLKASIKKAQATSSLLLGNAYEAATFVQMAFSIFGLDTVHLYGVYSAKQFMGVLERFPLLQAEFVTKNIAILSETYLLAEKYELALMILKMEFSSLSYYPIDFLQILKFMISLYCCQSKLKPRKRFQTLEENTLQMCRRRFRDFGTFPNLVEIQCIGTAYVTVVEMNMKKCRLSRAEKLAKDALNVLGHINNEVELMLIYIYLNEIHLHQNRNNDCFVHLTNMDRIVNENMPLEILALYMCVQSIDMILKLTGESGEEIIGDKIKKCNDFALNLTVGRIHLLKTDVALYVSVTMALWSLKSGQLCNWNEANQIFSQCYASALSFYEEMDVTKRGYWGIKGALLLFRVRMKFAGTANDLEETRTLIMKELNEIKKTINTHFPVFKQKCQCLMKDINSLEPEKMLDSIWTS